MTEYEIVKKEKKLELIGEIDVSNSTAFKDELYNIIDNSNNHITLDFAGLRYIDSAGLGILVGAYKRLKQRNSSMNIINAVENIKKLFIITKLDSIISINSPEEDAV